MNLRQKGFVLLSLMLLVIFIPFTVSAESSINISIEEGYDNRAKMGRAFPIKITLENNGGDFSGEMLIPFMTDYTLGGTKSVKVDLPANSKKEYTVIIPGSTDMHYSATPFEITIFEGNRKNGKKVKITGKKSLSPILIDYSEPTLGILTENLDRFKALQLVKILGFTPKIAQLNENNIPGVGLGLQHFDLIVVDDYPMSLLSEEQQQALISWVKNGGTLITGASAKGHHAWGQLESIIPINVADEVNISDLSFLSSGDESDFNISSLKVSTGTLHQNAEVKVTSEEIPIVALNKVGKGEILQIAFSLGEDPIASWSDYHIWLESILNQADLQGLSGSYYYESDYLETYYSLGHVNELFPVSQLSISTIILIMFGYLVAIVPILYFVLLKKNKREHAWWIIPTIAIVVSSGVFGIGAKDRLGAPILAELGVYAATQDGDLIGEYSLSLFSNTSGEYQIVLPRNEFIGVSVMNHQRVFGEGHEDSVIMTDTMLTDDFHFPDMDYWSARTIVGKHTKTDVGQFEIDLELVDDQLIGTIANQYSYDFDQIFIWSGSHIYELGSLKQGDSLKVEQSLQQKLLMRPMQSSAFLPGNSNLAELKRNELENALVHNIDLLNRFNSPIVFGYTKANISNAEMVNKNEENDRLSLIYMPFIAEGSISGDFNLGNNLLTIDIQPITGQVYGKVDEYNFIDLENGSYDVIVSLPTQLDHTQAEFESIRFKINDHHLDILLLDQVTGDYIEIVDGTNQAEFTEDLNRFISPEGTIQLKFEKDNPEHDPYTMFPEITVKGAVK